MQIEANPLYDRDFFRRLHMRKYNNKESIFPDVRFEQDVNIVRAYVKCAELTIVMNHMRYILPEYVRCTFMRWMRYSFSQMVSRGSKMKAKGRTFP